MDEERNKIMIKWDVGDRVQAEQDNVIKVGEVLSVETHEVERSRFDYYTRKETKYTETEIKCVNVKWDDGEVESLSQYHIHAEDTDIERQYRIACSDALARIDEKLAIASAALEEAEAISNETGVPFYSSISPLGQSYLPESLQDRFPDIDRSFANDLAGAYGEYEGWQHSAVC